MSGHALATRNEIDIITKGARKAQEDFKKEVIEKLTNETDFFDKNKMPDLPETLPNSAVMGAFKDNQGDIRFFDPLEEWNNAIRGGLFGNYLDDKSAGETAYVLCMQHLKKWTRSDAVFAADDARARYEKLLGVADDLDDFSAQLDRVHTGHLFRTSDQLADDVREYVSDTYEPGNEELEREVMDTVAGAVATSASEAEEGLSALFTADDWSAIEEIADIHSSASKDAAEEWADEIMYNEY